MILAAFLPNPATLGIPLTFPAPDVLQCPVRIILDMDVSRSVDADLINAIFVPIHIEIPSVS
jgi:hypothetical protein